MVDEDTAAELEELIQLIDEHLAQKYQSGFSTGKLLILRSLCYEELDLILFEE